MGKVFNLDSRDRTAGGPIKLLANLIFFQAMADGADEIIFTLKSRAEWTIDAGIDHRPPDTAKIQEVERVPLMEPQPIIPDQITKDARLEDLIRVANRLWPPPPPHPQVLDLVYVIPGKGRVHSTPPPVFCYPHLIRLLLLNANIPFVRALFLRVGIPYWNHGPVAGTFQTASHHLPELNTL